MHLELVAAVLIGVFSGFLNTLASGGSAVALPLLIATGLSPAIANATNRLPVLFGFGTASLTFFRAGIYRPALVARVLIPSVSGGIVGVMLADGVSSHLLLMVINGALLVALVLLFTAIKNVLLKAFEAPERYRLVDVALLFLVGIWLGLIVIDGATYLMLVLILGMRMQLPSANAYKALVGFTLNVVAVALFARNGHVDWTMGATMAVGSVAGGYIGARLSLSPHAKIWTFRVLVAVMAGELVHMAVQYWQERVAAGL
jgi:uncharacterized membrane protein YfcA